jgi:hypothetical protein
LLLHARQKVSFLAQQQQDDQQSAAYPVPNLLAVGRPPAVLGHERQPGGLCSEVEEVFAFATRIESWNQWDTQLAEVKKTSEGPVGAGTTWQEVRHLMGRRMESSNEITEYEPNRKLSFKSTSGPFPVEGSYTFESVEGGTRVTMVGQGETGGFFKLADPIVARMVKRQLEAGSANLKDLLEAQA